MLVRELNVITNQSFPSLVDSGLQFNSEINKEKVLVHVSCVEKGPHCRNFSAVPPITTCTNPPNALRPVLPPILVHYRAKVFRHVHTSLQKNWTNESFKNIFVIWRKQAMQKTRNKVENMFWDSNGCLWMVSEDTKQNSSMVLHAPWCPKDTIFPKILESFPYKANIQMV